jgi:peptidoglycan/LPS O-acetylase OafA/YrhL
MRYLGYAALGLLLTIALSSISYRWLESPFLRLKDRFAVVQSRPV